MITASFGPFESLCYNKRRFYWLSNHILCFVIGTESNMVVYSQKMLLMRDSFEKVTTFLLLAEDKSS